MKPTGPNRSSMLFPKIQRYKRFPIACTQPACMNIAVKSVSDLFDREGVCAEPAWHERPASPQRVERDRDRA